MRYGYVYGALASVSDLASHCNELADPIQLKSLVRLCTTEWHGLLSEAEAHGSDVAAQLLAANTGESGGESALLRCYERLMCERLHARVEAGTSDPVAFAVFDPIPLPGVVLARRVALMGLIKEACSAFFFGDLLRGTLELMANAQGSFGLVLSHSLDAGGEVVFASRGQTMSIAFYPALGCVTFGSEAAATKVCMGMKNSAPKPPKPPKCTGPDPETEEALSFRFDLDDVAGEVVLLRWGEVPQPPAMAHGASSGILTGGPGTRHLLCCAGHDREAVEVCRLSGGDGNSGGGWWRKAGAEGAVERSAQRVLLCVNIVQHGEQVSMWQRRLQLDGNPLLSAPPNVLCADPVGRDLLDTPRILGQITSDFDARGVAAKSANLVSAWTFTNKLRQRLKRHRSGTHDGSVDILITGCEVSLWVGEQFAADLQLVYPRLRIEVRADGA